MRFGTYHVFQCPPGVTPARVMAEEIQRAVFSEEFGFDDIWVPEQHFSPYCLCGDALLMAAHLATLTLWMGPGGVSHDLLVRSMRLFAEQVIPQFR